MFRLKRISLLFSFMLLQFSINALAKCQLEPQKTSNRIYEGQFYISSMNTSVISLDKKYGNLSEDKQRFNLDFLYEIKGGGSTSRFRFGEKFFLNGSTHLGMIQLETGSKPLPPGVYSLYSLTTLNDQNLPSLVMIGDSITWWSVGNSFRCLLSPFLRPVNFEGPHKDTFGYGHAGEGGDTTLDILKRISNISRAEYYFLLAGTNDWKEALPPQKTFSNIKAIAKILSKRGGLVMISTILPRLDEHDSRNQSVNTLLREWGGQGCNCKIVDLDLTFRRSLNIKDLYWDNGVHPNIKGYQEITRILGPEINVILH